MNLLKRGQGSQNLIDDGNQLVDFETILKVSALVQELLEVFLCTLHDNVGIFFDIILIAFHFGHQVAIVLHDPLAL